MLTQYQKNGCALARGFVIFTMPAIHTVLFYSIPEVQRGILGNTLAIIAETAGAPLFMYLMGFFLFYSRPKTFKQILTRSLWLLLAGYLLNALKLLLPYYSGWIDDSFFLANGIG